MASDLAAAVQTQLRPEPVAPPVRPGSRIAVTAALTQSDIRTAALLVESLYASRGYLASRFDADTESDLVLIAAENGAAVGTLTLRLDGPAGLRADECYDDELDAARAEGRRLCEVGRLAVARNARSMPVIRALFEHVHEIMRESDLTDVFIEVNPRHAAFYRRVFGFDVAGGECMCPRVLAPAVLLRLDLAAFEARLRASGGTFMDERLARTA